MNTLLHTFSLQDLKTYYQWRLLQTLAPYLNKNFVNAYFSFEQQYLNDQKEPTPLSLHCEQVVDNYMGDALGHAYVKKYFDPNAKKIALSLMHNIMKAFENDLNTADWLDAPTRQAALQKLHHITVRIGYPNQWRSYDGLTISKTSFLNNILNAATFNKTYKLKKIGQKTNPGEFSETPQTIDAAYIPTTNSIEILAGILQPPYFSKDADLAENYGGIGLVMAHELIHGFDSSGRKFDANGVMRDWWTQSTEEKYLNKMNCLIKQYDSYTVLPNIHINGKLTITENIADTGAIKLAYIALTMAEPIHSQKTGPFTSSQKFFLTFSQAFCGKMTDEFLKNSINDNPHTPPRFRVNGMIVNSPDFSSVFQCTKGHSAMSPTTQCEVW